MNEETRVSILDALLNKNREAALMDFFLSNLIRWVMRMSLHHANRRVGVKCRKWTSAGRVRGQAYLKCVERGSMAFEKCEHREATRRTDSKCSTDDFQKIDGFILLKSTAIQNILLHEFLTRARRT